MNSPDSAMVMALEARVRQFAGVMESARVTRPGGEAPATEAAMRDLLALLKRWRESGATVYVIGNGGSAAVASHAVTDFLNVGRMRATTVHDSSLMTCMANDFGYEVAYANILKVMARPGDGLIAISSSGRSRNITNAVAAFREAGGTAVTLSGFAPDNPLRALGDYNVWLDSTDYGFVEIGHQFVLHNLADRLRVGQ